jgi:hypothetical protein
LLLCRKHRNARVRTKTLSYPVGSLVYKLWIEKWKIYTSGPPTKSLENI